MDRWIGLDWVRMLSLVLASLMILSPNIAPVEAQPGSGFNTAMEITPGVYSYYISGRGQSHYYKIQVSSGEVLTIKLDIPSSQDFDLYLYDADQREVASSTLRGVEERIEYTPRLSGTYYIKVIVFSGDGTYSLTVSISNFKVIYTGWGETDSPIEVGPGDVGTPLSVTVRVEGNYTVTSLTATLSLPSAFTNITGGSLARAYHNGQVSPGGTFTFTFTLNIASDAQIDVYRLDMTIDYYRLSGSTLVKANPVNVQVSVNISGKSFLEVNASPNFLTAGTSNSVTINVSNKGTARTGPITLTLTLPSPLTLGGRDNKWLIPSIFPGRSSTVTCNIYAPTSSKGNTYQITASLTYDTVVGTERTETRTLILAVPLSEENPSILISTSGQMLTAGKTNELTITLTNNASSNLQSIEATLNIPSPLALMEKDNYWNISSLPPSESRSIIVKVYAPPAAKGSTYISTLTLSYKSPSGDTLTSTRSIALTVTKTEKISISITAEGQDMVAGGKKTLTLTITNEDLKPIYLLEISIGIPSPLILTGQDDRWLIPKLDPSESATITAEILSPLESLGSTAKATLTISYKTESGVELEETRTIGLSVLKSVKGRAVFSLVADMYELVATTMNDVNIDVYNTGEGSARSVLLTLDMPQSLSIIGRGNTWFVQEIPAGGSIRLPLKIYAPSSARDNNYQGTLTITYKDDYGNERTDKESIGFSVKGFIDLMIVDVIQSPSPAITNRSLTISGTVTNLGIVTAKAVNISIVPEDPFISTDGSSLFLYDILSGGEVSFTVSCNVRATKPGTYPLSLILAYKDDRNTWQTEEERIFVKVSGGTLEAGTRAGGGAPPRGGTSSGGVMPSLDMVLGGLVGFGVGAPIMLFLYRRRSLHPSNFTGRSGVKREAQTSSA